MTRTRFSIEEKETKETTSSTDETKHNGDYSAATNSSDDVDIGVDIYIKDKLTLNQKTFQNTWLQRWPWLSRNDFGSMICRYCTESNMKNNFTIGCSNFRSSSLRRHAGTRDHRKAAVDLGHADTVDGDEEKMLKDLLDDTAGTDNTDNNVDVSDKEDDVDSLEKKLMPRPSLVVEARPLVGIKRNYREVAKPIVSPKRKRIRKSKTFQDHWKMEWPWLDRNDSGGMICTYCIDNDMTNAFTVGCSNYRTSSLKRHAETRDHVFSMVEYDHEESGSKEDSTAKLLSDWPWLKKDESGAMSCTYCVDSNKSNSFTIGCYNVRTSALKRHSESRDHKLSLPDKPESNDITDSVTTVTHTIINDITSRGDVPVFRTPRKERKKRSVDGSKEESGKKKRDRSRESPMKNFQAGWIKIWPWLELNENEAMVCKYCTVNNQTNAFTVGCTNFRTSSVRRHAGTRDHELSVKVFESLVEVKE